MCARTPRAGTTHHGARSTEHCAQTRLSLLSVISVCSRKARPQNGCGCIRVRQQPEPASRPGPPAPLFLQSRLKTENNSGSLFSLIWLSAFHNCNGKLHCKKSKKMNVKRTEEKLTSDLEHAPDAPSLPSALLLRPATVITCRSGVERQAPLPLHAGSEVEAEAGRASATGTGVALWATAAAPAGCEGTATG